MPEENGINNLVDDGHTVANGDLHEKTTVISSDDEEQDQQEQDNNTTLDSVDVQPTTETTFDETSDSSSDDNGDDSQDEVDSEDEDEDEPPKLKYTRLNKLPPNFLTKDPISTATFHESYFIFATHSGIIHICTHTFEPIRTFKAHRASVLCIYTDGTYFATASMDGTVVIGSIKDEKDIVAYDFQRPVHAVVLDANYSKTRNFISGGMSGKVVYSSKGWLGKRSDTILDQGGNGPIVSIQLVDDDLLFWMNDKGINVFYLPTRLIISVFEKPEDSPRSDLYWPRASRPDLNRLLIAWGNYIWSLKISIKVPNPDTDKPAESSRMSKILPSTASITFRPVQEKEVEIEHIFKVDSLICGIASFTDDLWMIMTYEPPTIHSETHERTYHNPELKLINSINGEVEFEEELGLRDIANLGLNDFLLGSYISDIPQYYIISAKDGVIAQEFQMNDRLKWYLDREQYLQAWEISEHLVLPMKRLYYGIQYVDSLIKDDEWDIASEFLSKLLNVTGFQLDNHSLTQSSKVSSEDENDVLLLKEIIKQWETWAGIFLKSGHIKELTDIIPLAPEIGLPRVIYNDILNYWLLNDVQVFSDLIQNWDQELYDVSSIESKLEDTINEAEEKDDNDDNTDVDILTRVLISLYDETMDSIKAVPHLIHLKDPNIITYLSKNHILVNFIHDLPEMIQLRFQSQELQTMSIDKLESKLDDIISIFVKHRLEIPPKQIIETFSIESDLSFISFFYLEKLDMIDNYLSEGFGNERIQLYAQYRREKLRPFLMKSTNNNDYNIDEAIEICERMEYIEELVYLLGKIGENKKALELIVQRLDDPIMAIEFAKHQNDREAWGILLDYSIEKPRFIKALIENSDESSNMYYDPITILKRIPKDMKVDGLNKSVIEFSKNNDLNMILNQIILKIIYMKSEETSKSYKLQKLKGVEVEMDRLELQELIQLFETIVVLQEKENDVKLVQECEITTDCDNSSFINLRKKLNHLKDLKRKLLP